MTTPSEVDEGTMSVMAAGAAGAWLTADPEQVRAAARALAATAQSNERTLNVLESAAGELVTGNGWQGQASQRFLAHWGARSAQLRAQITNHRDASLALERFATELAEAQADFNRAAGEAELLGGTLSPGGQVTFPDPLGDGVGTLLTTPVGGALNPDVQAVTARAQAAVERVQLADRTVTVALNTLAGEVQVPAPDAPAGLPALLSAGRGGTVPGAADLEGIDPAFAAAWFGALSPMMQNRLIRAAPGLIGNMDGLPPAARDQANRILIQQAIVTNRGRLAEASGVVGLPGNPWLGCQPATEETARLETREQTLQRLLARDDLQILSIDPEGDGRAVVTMGDLTTASNVAIRIPGTGNHLDNLLENPIKDGILLRETIAEVVGPEAAESTAVVTWLDYDAPDDIPYAVADVYAREAGPALSQFNEGLRAIYQGDPHVTFLGHSYGSTVIGLTAAEHGLQADELVFFGSPGVGVGSVEELNLGEGTNVWASLNGNDDIKLANRRYVDRWILGPDPTGTEFGAQSFTSNAGGGHSDYFDRDGVALENFSQIVTGNLEAVR